MLTTGDHFGMKDGLVYCRVHFETLVREEYQERFDPVDVIASKTGPMPSGVPYYNGTVQKGRPRKRRIPPTDADLTKYNAGKLALQSSDMHVVGGPVIAKDH